jgi:hypothetical protein
MLVDYHFKPEVFGSYTGVCNISSSIQLHENSITDRLIHTLVKICIFMIFVYIIPSFILYIFNYNRKPIHTESSRHRRRRLRNTVGTKAYYLFNESQKYRRYKMWEQKYTRYLLNAFPHTFIHIAVRTWPQHLTPVLDETIYDTSPFNPYIVLEFSNVVDLKTIFKTAMIPKKDRELTFKLIIETPVLTYSNNPIVVPMDLNSCA